MKQEPVAYWDGKHFASKEKSALADIPLYTRSDVGDYYEGWEEGYQACKKDTAPRELSDEEILEYSDYFSLDMGATYEFTDSGLVKFARAILKKASEK